VSFLIILSLLFAGGRALFFLRELLGERLILNEELLKQMSLEGLAGLVESCTGISLAGLLLLVLVFFNIHQLEALELISQVLVEDATDTVEDVQREVKTR